MKNSKIIILALTSFILISFVFLSVIEKQQADINSKNVWMIYFENPKNDSLNFSIENHSQKNDFHWTVSVDKNKIQQGDTSIENGKTKLMPITLSDTKNKKVTVTVTDGNNIKEIYKSL
jgi:cell division protein YceG involved in septum cleavage